MDSASFPEIRNKWKKHGFNAEISFRLFHPTIAIIWSITFIFQSFQVKKRICIPHNMKILASSWYCWKSKNHREGIQCSIIVAVGYEYNNNGSFERLILFTGKCKQTKLAPDKNFGLHEVLCTTVNTCALYRSFVSCGIISFLCFILYDVTGDRFTKHMSQNFQA